MTTMSLAPDGILDLSVRMLALAHAGDWEGVALLEVERGRLLDLLPAADPSMQETMKTLLVHNEEIRVLAGQAQERIGKAMDQHQLRHRALSAYLHAGSD